MDLRLDIDGKQRETREQRQHLQLGGSSFLDHISRECPSVQPQISRGRTSFLSRSVRVKDGRKSTGCIGLHESMDVMFYMQTQSKKQFSALSKDGR